MPKGKPNAQTVATGKWQKEAGYMTKGFKIKRELAEQFAAACEKTGISQAKQISNMMRNFIFLHLNDKPVLKVYPVIFTETNGKDEAVLIEVPDFNIFTEGYGIHDAVFMARDAIGLSGIQMQDEGQSLPEPTKISDIDITKGEFFKNGKSFVSLVDIDFNAYRRTLT